MLLQCYRTDFAQRRPLMAVIPQWHAMNSLALQLLSMLSVRDGMMRSDLESRLAFVSPTELLLAVPISGPSQRLLGAYTSQAAGLRSQTLPRERYSHGGAVAAVTAFYAHPGVSVTTANIVCVQISWLADIDFIKLIKPIPDVKLLVIVFVHLL